MAVGQLVRVVVRRVAGGAGHLEHGVHSADRLADRAGRHQAPTQLDQGPHDRALHECHLESVLRQGSCVGDRVAAAAW